MDFINIWIVPIVTGFIVAIFSVEYSIRRLSGSTGEQVSGHATDMSKVYFGRNEMLAATSINFEAKGTLRGTLESSEVVQPAII